MYLAHFGFTESPFSIAPDSHFLFLTGRHQEALAHLVYGIQEGNGLLLFTGEVGTGKTTVLRYLLEQLPENTHIALILNPKLSELEFLETICDELGVPYPKDSQSFKTLQNALNEHLLETYRNGGHTVLIIDEAQHLSPELLENIRLLTNLETQKRKLLQIVLVGQPELRSLLEHPTLKQVAQRIVARYHLTPLSRRETKGYIAHRLQKVGGEGSLFSSLAFRKIFFLTRGVPRLINILCDRCLLAAFAMNRTKITRRLVKKSSKEIFDFKQKKSLAIRLFFAFGLVVLSALLFFLWKTGDFTRTHFAHFAPSVTPKRMFLGPYFQRPESRDSVFAYRTLFALWGLFLPRESTTEEEVCRFAEENHLRCVAEQGTWDKIRLWNHPGILRLYGKAGDPIFTVLLSLRENTAVIAIGSNRLTLSKEDLNPYWRGEYFALWRPTLDEQTQTNITPYLWRHDDS